MQADCNERRGCFVFLCRDNVREVPKPSVSADKDHHGHVFHPGDLVSIDCIRSSVEKSNGIIYLRLADGAGWISFSRGNLQELAVEEGLWSFYIDNYPAGQALRRHPIDSNEMHVKTDLDESIVYQPMQKIFCDRKVQHPITAVNFYRVQGTCGWVFDRRSGKNVSMLLPTCQVQTGIFCFQAISNTMVRKTCTINEKDGCLTPLMVEAGDMVAVDIIRSDEGDENNGPYLHLTDGSGWLLQKKESEIIMKEVPVLYGVWELQILHPPAGIALRRHPIDCQGEDRIYKDQVFPDKCLVQANCKVSSPTTGVNFYLISGTKGWLFDRRGDDCHLQVLTNSLPPTSSVVEGDGEGWTPDFVRGVAASIDGVEEVSFHPCSHVLGFETGDGARFDVYCKTRTVGVRIGDRPHSWYRKCAPRDLWMHLKQDVAALINTDNRTTVGECEDSNENKEEMEEKLRKDLLLRDKEIQALIEKRAELIRRIKILDDDRAKVCKEMKEQADERKKEFDIMKSASLSSSPRRDTEQPEILSNTSEVSGLHLNPPLILVDRVASSKSSSNSTNTSVQPPIAVPPDVSAVPVGEHRQAVEVKYSDNRNRASHVVQTRVLQDDNTRVSRAFSKVVSVAPSKSPSRAISKVLTRQVRSKVIADDSTRQSSKDVRSRIEVLLQMQSEETRSHRTDSFGSHEEELSTMEGTFEHTDNDTDGDYSSDDDENFSETGVTERCKVCKMMFGSSNALTEHYRKKHHLYCADCNKVYESQRDLDDHKYFNHRLW